MSASEVKVSGKSEAEVAYDLFVNIARVEVRNLYPNGDNPADRDYILSTYAQCIHVVRNAWYEPR